jgi:hypothetical protein
VRFCHSIEMASAMLSSRVALAGVAVQAKAPRATVARATVRVQAAETKTVRALRPSDCLSVTWWLCGGDGGRKPRITTERDQRDPSACKAAALDGGVARPQANHSRLAWGLVRAERRRCCTTESARP